MSIASILAASCPGLSSTAPALSVGKNSAEQLLPQVYIILHDDDQSKCSVSGDMLNPDLKKKKHESLKFMNRTSV